MSALLAAISALAGIGSIVCFILVVIHFFKSDQTTLGIVCIVLVFCGIGGLIAYVKGWMDGDGKLQERIYDVVVSDGRKIDSDGRCKEPVGDTVDLENATWSNTIGDPEMIAVWKDPDFDPLESAFYYVRVLEIPTPRWTAYDARYYGVEMAESVEMKSQERAYTSPIWYSPEE